MQNEKQALKSGYKERLKLSVVSEIVYVTCRTGQL